MEPKEKKLCEYGAKCYRKNPQHLEEFSHPDKIDGSATDIHSKDIVKMKDVKRETRNSPNKKMKQTTLSFPKKCDYSSAPKIQTSEGFRKKVVVKNDKKESTSYKNSPRNNRLAYAKALKRKRKNSVSEKNKPKILVQSTDTEATNFMNSGSDGDGGSKKPNQNYQESDKSFNSDCEGVQNIPSSFTSETNCLPNLVDVKDKSNNEIIKTLFLVEMPSDFYSFYDFCKSLNESNPDKALEICELKLAGPFDVLSDFTFCRWWGFVPFASLSSLFRGHKILMLKQVKELGKHTSKMSYSVDRDLFLCHWRFYYDPPEFQTVLVTDSLFHIGYWRDEPNQSPVFLASNDSDKDYTFKIEAENIFGTVFHFMNNFMKSCDPFKKAKIITLQKALSNWAGRNKFSLEMNTSKMKERQKKVVAKTFHGAGIVVPVQPKSQVGYRPLIETEANLKRILKLIMEADDEEEKESTWENLQPLITAANIANDECDFGNSLELGIDLFCVGSPIFHKTVEHLLSTAYSLLERVEFCQILKAHLKFRRKVTDFFPCRSPICMAIRL